MKFRQQTSMIYKIRKMKLSKVLSRSSKFKRLWIKISQNSPFTEKFRV